MYLVNSVHVVRGKGSETASVEKNRCLQIPILNPLPNTLLKAHIYARVSAIIGKKYLIPFKIPSF